MLKIKLKESALVNVNKSRCSLKINTFRCKLSVTIWKSAYWGPAKDPFI